jgi:lipopolysaccharide export system permease protein
VTTLDRLYFVGFVRSYLIVLVSLLSLYIIVDLFTNLDDFSKGNFGDNLRHITSYYTANVAKIFNQLSELITLIGAMFTVAWMQRSNELLPQLSAGISTQRVMRPILFGCMLTIALGPLNQELFIPAVAGELQKKRDDPNLEKAVPARGAFDPTGVHLEGYVGLPKDKKILDLCVTFPAEANDNPLGMLHVTAREGMYVPPTGASQTGGWKLYQTTPADIDGPFPPYFERLSVGVYFLKTSEVDYDALTGTGNAYLYASTDRLRETLEKPESRRQANVAVAFHMRFTRPLVGVLLVLMGLGVILRDQNKNVFVNVGLCLILCVIFYVVFYGCKFLGENDILAPAPAAWLPVIIFGPFAFVLFDAAHT